MRLSLICCAAILTSVADAESFCSLNVTVRSSIPTESIKVVVEEESGRKIEKRAVEGKVSFCDLGIRPVTVVVGSPGCSQGIVRNVPMKWNESRSLAVWHDNTLCQGEAMPVAACDLLFRIIGQERRPVSLAAIELTSPVPKVLSADEYGRAFLRITAGQIAEGRVVAEGFSSESVKVECTFKNIVREESIYLRRR